MGMRFPFRATSISLVLLHLTSTGALPDDRPTRAGDRPGADAREPFAALTLADAHALVLARSPELASVASEVRARESHALQEGLLPNPELRTDLENVGGSGDREEFEETETTVRLSQRIELGGKRGKRRRVAELGHELATWD